MPKKRPRSTLKQVTVDQIQSKVVNPMKSFNLPEVKIIKEKEQESQQANEKAMQERLVIKLSPEVRETIKVPVRIKGTKESILGLLDTGASANVVSNEVILRLGLLNDIKPAAPITLADAGGKTSLCDQAITLPVEIKLGKIKLEIAILCYVSEAVKRDMYIGLPFVLKYEELFKFKELYNISRKQEESKISQSSEKGIKEVMNERKDLGEEDIDQSDCVVDAAHFVRKIDKAEVAGIISVSNTRNAEISELCSIETEVRIDGMERYKETLMKEFKDIIRDDEPTELPPSRITDHRIDLIADTSPVARPQYRLSIQEREALDENVKKLLKQGFIKESASPFNAPILFVKKKDGSLRMCVDFRSLNNFTIKNKFPLPLIDEILDSLGEGKVFSKLDLMSGYYQIRLKADDTYKTAFSTSTNHYEWQVMPFGLTNAPATFQNTMNKLLGPYLRQFVLVYMDDIIVYSPNVELHKKHLKMVFQKLKEGNFIAKKSKCELFCSQISFLGFVISADGLKTDPAKVETVKNWEIPKTPKQCAGFLGLTGFYRRFVQGYSKVAAPLLDYAAKKVEWSDVQQQAFETLKQKLITAPTLIIPKFEEGYTFRVTCDASDFAVGFVLEQLGPNGSLRGVVAYGSKKLAGAQLRYPVREKEFLSVVQALHTWKSLLLLRPFVVRTDHYSLQYLKQQSDVNNSRLARWLDFISQFEFSIEYLPGSRNSAADALSRKEMLDTDGQVSVEIEEIDGSRSVLCVNDELKKEIQDKYDQCSICSPIVRILRDGGAIDKSLNNHIKHFKWKDGLLFYDVFINGSFSRIVVPNDQVLRQKLLSNAHDSPSAGHFGALRTYELLARLWYWPHMMKSVKKYVGSCLVCQQSKPSTQLSQGLFSPIPIPDGRWNTITMDFSSGLPTTAKGHDMILVIVDKFSKRAHFIPCKKTITAAQTARLFVEQYFKHHGIPTVIITDKDIRFMGAFWKTFHEIAGTSLLFSTTNHPQTDGQSERTIRILNQLLRAYCHRDLHSWDQWLPVLEFAYNSASQASIKMSPFELDLGYVPSSPAFISPSVGPRFSPSAEELMKELDITTRFVQDRLVLAQHSQEIHHNRNHRYHEYKIGDWILLNKDALILDKSYRKIQPAFFGPYKLVKKINDNAFEVDIPVTSLKHRTINIKWFRPFNERSSTYPKVPPRTMLEAKARLSEITSVAGYDPRKQELTVTWKDCHPGHTFTIPYSLFNMVPKSLRKTLIHNAKVFTRSSINDEGPSDASNSGRVFSEGRIM